MSGHPVTTRKKRRGLIEKRRRDKINSSLSELRRLVPTAFEKQGSAKLEKAEILQLTVEYLRNLHERGMADSRTSDKQLGLCEDSISNNTAPSSQESSVHPTIPAASAALSHHHQQQQTIQQSHSAYSHHPPAITSQHHQSSIDGQTFGHNSSGINSVGPGMAQSHFNHSTVTQHHIYNPQHHAMTAYHHPYHHVPQHNPRNPLVKSEGHDLMSVNPHSHTSLLNLDQNTHQVATHQGHHHGLGAHTYSHHQAVNSYLVAAAASYPNRPNVGGGHQMGASADLGRSNEGTPVGEMTHSHQTMSTSPGAPLEHNATQQVSSSSSPSDQVDGSNNSSATGRQRHYRPWGTELAY